MMFCKKCSTDKVEDDFRTCVDKRYSRTYLISICKSCEKAEALKRYYKNREKNIQKNKEYKEKNKEEIKIKRKEYLEKNKEYIKERYKLYCINNREKINKIARDYKKDNLSIKLRGNFRNRIKEGLKIKNKSTLEYIDTTMENVINWLEFNFAEDMNWENYGSIWNIDHTLPLNKFDFTKEEDIFICFNWRNLMPMYCKQNIAKSDKILHYLIFKQEYNIKTFISLCDDIEKNKTESYIKIYAKYFNNLIT